MSPKPLILSGNVFSESRAYNGQFHLYMLLRKAATGLALGRQIIMVAERERFESAIKHKIKDMRASG
jgi:hypothetical protein